MSRKLSSVRSRTNSGLRETQQRVASGIRPRSSTSVKAKKGGGVLGQRVLSPVVEAPEPPLVENATQGVKFSQPLSVPSATEAAGVAARLALKTIAELEKGRQSTPIRAPKERADRDARTQPEVQGELRRDECENSIASDDEPGKFGFQRKRRVSLCDPCDGIVEKESDGFACRLAWTDKEDTQASSSSQPFSAPVDDEETFCRNRENVAKTSLGENGTLVLADLHRSVEDLKRRLVSLASENVRLRARLIRRGDDPGDDGNSSGALDVPRSSARAESPVELLGVEAEYFPLDSADADLAKAMMHSPVDLEQLQDLQNKLVKVLEFWSEQTRDLVDREERVAKLITNHPQSVVPGLIPVGKEEIANTATALPSTSQCSPVPAPYRPAPSAHRQQAASSHVARMVPPASKTPESLVQRPAIARNTPLQSRLRQAPFQAKVVGSARFQQGGRNWQAPSMNTFPRSESVPIQRPSMLFDVSPQPQPQSIPVLRDRNSSIERCVSVPPRLAFDAPLVVGQRCQMIAISSPSSSVATPSMPSMHLPCPTRSSLYGDAGATRAPRVQSTRSSSPPIPKAPSHVSGQRCLQHAELTSRQLNQKRSSTPQPARSVSPVMRRHLNEVAPRSSRAQPSRSVSPSAPESMPPVSSDGQTLPTRNLPRRSQTLCSSGPQTPKAVSFEDPTNSRPLSPVQTPHNRTARSESPLIAWGQSLDDKTSHSPRRPCSITFVPSALPSPAPSAAPVTSPNRSPSPVVRPRSSRSKPLPAAYFPTMRQ